MRSYVAKHITNAISQSRSFLYIDVHKQNDDTKSEQKEITHLHITVHVSEVRKKLLNFHGPTCERKHTTWRTVQTIKSNVQNWETKGFCTTKTIPKSGYGY